MSMQRSVCGVPNKTPQGSAREAGASAQNSVAVLTRMPRDCTEPFGCRADEQSHVLLWSPDISNSLEHFPSDQNMKKVARAEAILNRVANKKQISHEGRDWLTLALDPFHDTDHQVAGFPDADNSKTVVSCYQYALDIAKPANITTATWDAHVFTLPSTGVGGATNTYSALTDAAGTGLIRNSTSKTAVRSLLNVEINNSGVNLFPASDAEANAATRTVDHITVSSSIFDGTMSRVIAMGFEIIDTTADVYKQGALTAYRMPQMGDTGFYSYVENDAVPAAVMEGMVYTQMVHAPPKTVAEALALNGTRQWQAAQGAYVVGTQSTTANPMHLSPPRGFNVISGSGKGSYAEISQFTGAAHVPPIPSNIAFHRTIKTPYNTSGVMLTGLNALSTFRIKFKIYVEMAPLSWQSDLVVLATPSAPYDPRTLELYSKALQHVPVAVVANDNSFGDWFAGIAEVIEAIAAPVGMALGTMSGGVSVPIGMVASALAGAGKNIVRGQKNDDKLYSGSQAWNALANTLGSRVTVKKTRAERGLLHAINVLQNNAPAQKKSVKKSAEVAAKKIVAAGNKAVKAVKKAAAKKPVKRKVAAQRPQPANPRDLMNQWLAGKRQLGPI